MAIVCRGRIYIIKALPGKMRQKEPGATKQKNMLRIYDCRLLLGTTKIRMFGRYTRDLDIQPHDNIYFWIAQQITTIYYCPDELWGYDIHQEVTAMNEEFVRERITQLRLKKGVSEYKNEL